MSHPYAGPASGLQVGQVVRPPEGVVWGEEGLVQVVFEKIIWIDRFCYGVNVTCRINGREQQHFCVRERSFADVIVVDDSNMVYLGLQRRPNDAGIPRIQGFAGSIEKEEGLYEAARREFTEEFRATYRKEVEIDEVVLLGPWTQNDSKLGDQEPRHLLPNGHPPCKYGFGLMVKVKILGDIPQAEMVETDEVIDQLPPIPLVEAVRYAFMGVAPAGVLGERYLDAIRCDNGDTTNLIFRAYLYLMGIVTLTDVEMMIKNLPFPVKL